MILKMRPLHQSAESEEPVDLTKFVRILTKQDQSLFGTKLVQVIIEYFWDDYSGQISNKVMYPFMFKFVVCMTYYYLLTEQQSGEASVFNQSNSQLDAFKS